MLPVASLADLAAAKLRHFVQENCIDCFRILLPPYFVCYLCSVRNLGKFVDRLLLEVQCYALFPRDVSCLGASVDSREKRFVLRARTLSIVIIAAPHTLDTHC